MKKITAILGSVLLSGLCFAANAGTLYKATTYSYSGSTMDNSFPSYASNMILTWGEDVNVSFVDNVTPSFTLTFPGEDGNESETLESIALGLPYSEPASSSPYVTLSLGYRYTPGSYTVSLPDGIIQNEAGDTNAAQTFTFTIPAGTFSQSAATITPAQSVGYDSNYNPIPTPFYQASELSAVTISWSDYTLEASGVGAVEYYLSYDNKMTLADSEVKVENNGIVLDLSSLTEGSWTISIPEGFVKAVKDDLLYVNSSMSLTYIVVGQLSPLDAYTLEQPTSKYLQSLNMVQLSFGQPIKMVDNAPSVTCTGGSTCTSSIYADYSGNYYLNVNIDPAITDAGNYTVTIPSGVVTNGKYENGEIELPFTVMPYDNNYVTVPADRSSLTSSEIREISITFPDVTSIEAVASEDWGNCSVDIQGGNSTNISVGNGITIDGNKLIISVGEIAQETYMINIRENDFILDGKAMNPRINFQFTVWNGLPAVTVLQAPEEYGKTSVNTTIQLTWGYQTIHKTDNCVVTIEGGYDGSVTVPAEDITLSTVESPEGITNDNNVLNLNLSNTLKSYLENASSSYVTLTLPEGAVANSSDQENQEYTISFYVYDFVNEDASCVETETPGVFNIVWEGTTWLGVVENPAPLTLTNADGDVYELTYSYEQTPGSYFRSYTDPDNYIGYCLGFDISELEEGIYTLNIPECVVFLNVNGSYTDLYNNAQTLIFGNGVDTGINDLKNVQNIENGEAVIYNLQGVRVNPNNLGKGLYIVNGKKVLVK